MTATPTDLLWQSLKKVQSFTSTVSSGAASKTGWTGGTEGTVEVVVASDDGRIDFIEHGTLTTAEGKTLTTHNYWQWERTADAIRLSHRRRDEPVLLAELRQASADGTFQSSSPHLCGADIYTIQLDQSAHTLRLSWQIDGPKKDETLKIIYRSD